MWRGKGPERFVALLFLAAAIGTGLLPDNDGRHYDHLWRNGFYVDVGLLALLLPIVLRANRYWPTWVWAVQVLVLGVHLTKAFNPSILPIVYAWAASKAAYLMLLILAIGTWRLRARVAIYGPVRDWTQLRW